MIPLTAKQKPTKAEVETIADQLAAWCSECGKCPLGEALDEAANVLYVAVNGWNEAEGNDGG